MTLHPPSLRQPSICFLTSVLTWYRVPFHQQVKSLLRDAAIDYELIHGQYAPEDETKNDSTTLGWATKIHNRHLRLGSRRLTWHPAWSLLMKHDLVVVGQENKLLLNYPLQLLRAHVRPRIALWGHGRNFQAGYSSGPLEAWKRFWLRQCDWWFTYTEETGRFIAAQGFPEERVTVLNNSVDTSAIRRWVTEVTEHDVLRKRQQLTLRGTNVGIFVGSLYNHKRLPFLISAARLIRRCVPDFELIIVGSGPDLPWARAHTQDDQWIRVLGPAFGRDKVELMRLGHVFLMPGLVGLAILDAAAVGLPLITTDYPYHSPEISYLEDGKTGVLVQNWQDETSYSEAVVALLRDVARRRALSAAAADMASHYSIESMAERFVQGVQKALVLPKR
jgi:glycosyltransferase involved in cell wall biosynthesis